MLESLLNPLWGCTRRVGFIRGGIVLSMTNPSMDTQAPPLLSPANRLLRSDITMSLTDSTVELVWAPRGPALKQGVIKVKFFNNKFDLAKTEKYLTDLIQKIPHREGEVDKALSTGFFREMAAIASWIKIESYVGEEEKVIVGNKELSLVLQDVSFKNSRIGLRGNHLLLSDSSFESSIVEIRSLHSILDRAYFGHNFDFSGDLGDAEILSTVEIHSSCIHLNLRGARWHKTETLSSRMSGMIFRESNLTNADFVAISTQMAQDEFENISLIKNQAFGSEQVISLLTTPPFKGVQGGVENPLRDAFTSRGVTSATGIGFNLDEDPKRLKNFVVEIPNLTPAQPIFLECPCSRLQPILEELISDDSSVRRAHGGLPIDHGDWLLERGCATYQEVVGYVMYSLLDDPQPNLIDLLGLSKYPHGSIPSGEEENPRQALIPGAVLVEEHEPVPSASPRGVPWVGHSQTDIWRVGT